MSMTDLGITILVVMLCLNAGIALSGVMHPDAYENVVAKGGLEYDEAFASTIEGDVATEIQIPDSNTGGWFSNYADFGVVQIGKLIFGMVTGKNIVTFLMVTLGFKSLLGGAAVVISSIIQTLVILLNAFLAYEIFTGRLFSFGGTK